jgi:hypothetical protein
MAKGEQNNNAKLTWEKVDEIRLSKEPSKIVAVKYGVSYNTINKVRNFRLWKVPKK